jgi:Mlc titration factor MtfA (ptsG expression regulator)
MIFKRRRQKKRDEVRAQPFPPQWERILEARFPLYRRLPPADREELHGHIHVFLEEKRFEGCDGFEVTDEVRLIVAAHACLLLLHRDTDYYPTTQSILVYPTTFLVDVAEAEDDWVVSEYTEDRAGESWDLGPVILSWDDVLDSIGPDAAGYNVILHEFSHQLDLENGEVDGVPRLESSETYETWADVFNDAYERFLDDIDAGRPPVLDDYGAESPSEFFAVAVEAFFEVPQDLKRAYPAVYEQLARYFLQDPLSWGARGGH